MADMGWLYEFWKRAKGYLAQRVACIEDAEDVASAVVVKLLKARSRVESGEVAIYDWENYAWRAVRNGLVDYYREKGKGKWLDMEACVEVAGEDVLGECEERDAVAGWCRRAMLSQAQAAAVRMRYCDRLRHDEIGEAMGVSKNAAKMLEVRAFQKLRAVA